MGTRTSNLSGDSTIQFANGLGQVPQQRDAEGNSGTAGFDANGNQVQVTDANGVGRGTAYDEGA